MPTTAALPATQYSMKYAEAAGLVKFDFLGLKTLTVLQTAVRLRWFGVGGQLLTVCFVYLVLGFPLPAGNWTVDGTGTWARGNRSWSVVTSTITPMHYNPACTVEPRIDAGQVMLTVTRNGANIQINRKMLAEIAVSLSPRASNVHFEDHLEDGRIAFDYRMHEFLPFKAAWLLRRRRGHLHE